MSQLPPGSGLGIGGVKPLQTYLGSGVRSEPIATHIQQPIASTGTTATTTTPPIPTTTQTPPTTSTPPTAPTATGDSSVNFAAPVPIDPFLSGAAANEPSSIPDVFSTPSLFGSMTSSPIASSASTLPPASSVSPHLSTLLNTSPSTTPRNSVFGESTFAIASNPSASSTNSSQSNGLVTPNARLEQVAASHPLGGSTLPPPAHPLSTSVSPPVSYPPSASRPTGPSLGAPIGTGATPGTTPNRNRIISTPLAAASHNPLQPLPPPIGLSAEPASPDEKLSTLLTNLFQGPPPPPKLASFDVSTVPHTEDGLTTLGLKGCWRELIRVGDSMLDSKDPTNAARQPHATYRIVHLYLAALIKLRKFDQAQQVVQQHIGNAFTNDKLYSSHAVYSQSSNVGNMLPFELHLLSAELPHYLGKTRLALDAMMKLLQFVRLQLRRKKNVSTSENAPAVSPTSVEFTEKRTSITDTTTGASTNPFTLTSPHTLTNATIEELKQQLKIIRIHIINLCLSFPSSDEIDFTQALAWLDELIQEYPDDTELYQFGLKIMLQLGDTGSATKYFNQLKGAYEKKGDKDHIQIGIHHVLLHLARNDYTLAHSTIHSLYSTHPFDIDVANNYAVCCLYVNLAQDGINALENLVRKDPINNLTSSVVSNLCALYDLSSSNPALKRRMIEGLTLQYGTDDLAIEQ